jgi:DNA-binding GntR family transcriptional regulator
MVSREDPAPIWQQVAAVLRQRIADGTITGRLPSERDLQQEFGVAPMTTRKAVRQLAEEGLVTTVAGRGTFVVRKDQG